MVLLKSLVSIAIIFSSTAAFASGEEPEADPRIRTLLEQRKQLCLGALEYTKTLKFFRDNKYIVIPEGAARKIADRVSKGCDGASERFLRVLLLLRNSGLSDPTALTISLEFAGYSPDAQKNFVAIFTRTFLNEFFDYEYAIAAKLAYELSRDYQGDPAQVREDFIDLVRFCKDGKNLDLPSRLCAEFTIKLVKLSQYHVNGVRKPFTKLFTTLRNDQKFALDVKTALDVTYNVLKNGPLGPDNFYSGYDFAIKKDGLEMTQLQALEFAMKMSDRSFTGERPPVVPTDTRQSEEVMHVTSK